MRNLKKVDLKGQAISKEYGFITFKQHEDALKALRAINNNPNIFNANKVNFTFLLTINLLIILYSI
jgi:nucleolar protein 4